MQEYLVNAIETGTMFQTLDLNLPLLSLRDPEGRLLKIHHRMIRIVSKQSWPRLSGFISSETARSYESAGRLVHTTVLDENQAGQVLCAIGSQDLLRRRDQYMLVEHEPIPFPSFPYEWPPEMLYEAGRLTLDLAEDLLAEGFVLKDATPYNVLFRGAHPVFVDVLSAERLTSAIWLPYAQFVRTFLLPLLVNKYFGFSLNQLLLSHRDGIEPQAVSRLCGILQRLRPPFLSLVTIPTWLGSRHNADSVALYKPRSSDNPEKAKFILGSLFKRLRRTMAHLTPKAGGESRWSGYTASGDCPQTYVAVKQSFVEGVMTEFQPKVILDIGCNTGQYSIIAARSGARVVAVDADPTVVGHLWRQSRAEYLDILPLVIDMTRPSPAVGWRNGECPSFLDRMYRKFDAVFMLAIVHHMIVSERIPLAEVVKLAAELTSHLVVIEFIGTDDPQFRGLSHGLDALYADLTKGVFEETCTRYFEILRCRQLGSTHRWLYLLSKNGTAIRA